MPNNSGIQPSEKFYWDKLKILAERASRDLLSGLLNRETATSYIEACLQKMSPDEVCALFIVDLDNFKQVNDTFGHQTGDSVIRQAAQALSCCFRATDIVGRLGGDEFFALLSGQVTVDTVQEKARLICEALQFSIGSAPTLHITASIGVHVVSGAIPNFEYLYEKADFALYEAKARGKNCFQISEGKAGNISKRHVYDTVQTPLQLSTLLEHMNEGISLLEINDSVRMLYASPSLRKMLNLEETLSLPCTLAALGRIHADDIAEYEGLLREGTKCRKPVEHEHRFTTNGINWGWRRVRAVQVPSSGDRTVVLVFSTDISATKKNEHMLLKSRELLKFLLEQENYTLWEVEPETKTFRLFSAKNFGYAPGARMGNFPDSLIDKGWVHPDSAARFRRFADEILTGCAAGGGTFILRHTMNKNYSWFSLAYRMLPDDGVHSPLVIGTAKRFAESDAQKIFASKELLRKALRPTLFCYMAANLSSDTVEALWLEGKNLTGRFRNTALGKLIKKEAGNLFFREETKDFLHIFSRGALLDIFNRGHTWLSREFRRIDAGGNIRRISYTAHLTKDPLLKDILLFAFLQDTEPRHAREAALKESIKNIPATGLYDRQSAKELTRQTLQNGTSSLHTLALIRVFGNFRSSPFKELHFQGRRNPIAMIFAFLLGIECVIGEHSGDSITLFWPDTVSRLAARQMLDNAFAFARLALSDIDTIDSLRFVSAVVCGDLRGKDYDALIEEAEYICGRYPSAPEDSVIFFSENASKELNSYRGEAEPFLFSPVSPQNLSESQRILLFRCLEALFTADTPDTGIEEFLGRIGSHYQADRAYIADLAENNQAVSIIHEWTNDGKPSIRNYLTGTPLARLPLFKRCVKEKKALSAAKKISTSSKTWSFNVFPLTANKENEPNGFFCLENPKGNMDDIALLSVLLPYIVYARRHFSRAIKEPDTSALQDSLTGLPNLRAYMDHAYLLNSESYNSMGALILNIPELPWAGKGQSFEQTAKILLYISEKLAVIFGKSLLFHMKDTEFVVFCPNTTHEVFLGRVLRIQSLLQHRYPKLLRFGYVWTDGVFSGEKLMREARIIAQCDQPNAPSAEARTPCIMETGWQKRFIVYLQPKIDMRSGAVFGAEALVRGINEEGKIVSPGRFIESMEKTGALRALDLHVLNQTLAVMERWWKQGLKNIPISVNFSRFTLFNTSTSGSVLALLSRFPSIPPKLLEIEITESAGDVESRSLEQAMDKLRPFGLRFALDDFGSRYANLSIFTNIPFDSVKLDRSLIRELSYNTVGRTLVGDIVRICTKQGMLCVAEGVETQAQVDVLLGEGCSYAQGFFYDRPMPIRDFEQKYLRQKDVKETLL